MILHVPCWTKCRITYVIEWQIIFALTRGLFWCLFPEWHSNEGNEYQNSTRVSTFKQFVTRVYALFYFLDDITNPKWWLKTTIFTHRPGVSLARFTFFWCHNKLLMTSQWSDKLWRDHVKSDILLYRYRLYSPEIFTAGRIRKNNLNGLINNQY